MWVAVLSAAFLILTPGLASAQTGDSPDTPHRPVSPNSINARDPAPGRYVQE